MQGSGREIRDDVSVHHSGLTQFAARGEGHWTLIPGRARNSEKKTAQSCWHSQILSANLAGAQ
ncbi:hypothetical protein MPSYJ_19200 [Mycolicibacterium psychrotolerans]|uniref:Uncharacterized protein n=1 Tax=Mycolicibacterium psychrotolerans TaxID=216929 RepID=A0A7I7MAT7_9MYCO|nr:hypothetical protein MPSYJ_19200 [Mycolicibacterium psychrotolerans]